MSLSEERTITLNLLGNESVTVPCSLFKKYPNCIFLTSTQDIQATEEFQFPTCLNLLEWEEISKVLKDELFESQLPLEVWAKASCYGLVSPQLYFIRHARNQQDQKIEEFLTGKSNLLLFSSLL